VKKSFTLGSGTMANPNAIYAAITVGKPWASPIFGGGTIVSKQLCGSIVNNPTGDPMLGQPGEILEFNSSDSSGPRSDALYAYEAASHAIYGAALLKAFNQWNPTGTVPTYLHNGVTDLIYKIENGYNSCGYTGVRVVDPSHPAAVDYPGEVGTDSPNSKGYPLEKAIWTEYLKL
jgi:hypothetical protein